MQILHLADVHLDRPFVRADRRQGDRDRARLRETFSRCIELAADRGVDAVTIGGDLWEDEHVSADTRRFVASQLARVGCPVLVICGNHDPLRPGGHYQRTSWPDNVTIFSEAAPVEHRLSDDVSVWGVSWTHEEPTAEFLSQRVVPEDGRAHLLLLHGTATTFAGGVGGPSYCPFDPAELLGAGFALALAGHIHAASHERGFVYPGSPEPLGWGERGRHCVALVTIDSGEADVELLDVNSHRYEESAVDCEGCEHGAECAERLVENLEGLEGADRHVRVLLRGEVSRECRVDAEQLTEDHREPFAEFQVVDETSPAYDLDAMAEQPSATGHFVKALRERIESEAIPMSAASSSWPWTADYGRWADERTSFVWIEHLDIRGYKRLRGEYDFDQRLSIICGANEAGKTSMHDAIVRALFGFSRSERRRSGGESELDRCQPWGDGTTYAIHATVHTEEGRIRIEWDFAEHDVTVRNLDSSEDLSARMSGSHGDVLLGQHLLGLDLADFRQACCVDQAEISAVASSESLVVAMQRAVELGTTESGVEAADARLRDALGSDIGVRVDNLQPTRAGRLHRLLDRREELRTELSRAEATQEEIAERERELQRLESERSEGGTEMLGVGQGLLRAKEQELAERLRRAREHSERASVDEDEGPDDSDEDHIAITSRLEELSRLENELAEQRPQAEAAKASVQELEGRRQLLQTQFDGLAGYSEVDTSGQAGVQGLVARRDDLIAAVGEPEPTAAPPSPEPAVASSRTPLWVAADSSPQPR